MKRVGKVIGSLIGVMLTCAALAVSASAADYEPPGGAQCDDCLQTHTEPTDHCSYYCEGDTLDPCSCGGKTVDWCTAEHQYTELVSQTAGTDCQTPGTATYACKCGATTTMDGAVGDHQWDDGDIDEAAGKIYYECKLCGETSSEDYEPDHTHDYDETVYAPTCTDEGWTHYVCACGSVYVDDFEDPLGHDMATTVIAATCTEQGESLYYCTRAGCTHTYTDNIVPALGHQAQSTVVAPTCTAEGYTNNVCTRANCGYDWISDRVPALGHNMINDVCTRCQLSITCVHTYTETVTPATCEEQGHTLYLCTKCGYTYMDHYTPALNHVWEQTGFRAATCERAGYEDYNCTRCGEADTKVLDAFGHSWQALGAVIGEDNSSVVTFECSTCKTHKTEILPTAAAQAQNWLLTAIRGASGGLIDMYNTVANGVEVGGVTLGEVIAGCLTLVAIVLFLGYFSFLIGRRK